MGARYLPLFVRFFVVPLLAAALVSGSLLTAPAQAKKVKPDFFGMHSGRVPEGQFPSQPVGAVRLWDTYTTWRNIETSQGNFVWTRLDRAVETARRSGAEPMIVLGQTPQFHATRPQAAGHFGPGATSMPKMRPWKRYVSKVAKRYKDKASYQIWNEPNVVNYWTGSPKQMARLTAAASKKIKKAAGRRATVVAPSFPLRLSGQRAWFAKYWKQRVGGRPMARYVDVASVNLYPLAHEEPEASMKLLKGAQQVLRRNGARRMPIWNTEINYGLLGGPTADPIPDSKQAAFVARTYLLNAGAKIERVYWYRWDMPPIANTLLTERDFRTLTPAGRAYGVVHDWLNRTNVRGCKEDRRGRDRGTYKCTARKGKKIRTFYWKPSGSPVKVRTPRRTISWETVTGQENRRKGRYRLKVGYSPIMVTSRR